jgi:hypothetical protein
MFRGWWEDDSQDFSFLPTVVTDEVNSFFQFTYFLWQKNNVSGE